MDSFKRLGKTIITIIGGLALLPICFVGSCTAIGVIGNILQEGARVALEVRNPGRTIRVVNDNPVDVSVSLEGQYMYRHYSYDPKSMGVLENLITGKTISLSETATSNLSGSRDYWLSDLLFVDLESRCIYSVTQPEICAIPILGRLSSWDENEDDYSLEFIIENSENIVVLYTQVQVFGFAQDVHSNPIAYTTRCGEDCRIILKQKGTDDVLIVTRRGNRVSSDGQYYSEYNGSCLTLYENGTKRQVAQTCRNDFVPSDRIRPLGWNATNDGYYFHVDFESPGHRGDVFLLPIP
ncbi:MAG: hypothetical protein GY805_32595 [Chloroflexi bacterium]|nr:hypothetical protein [Chloroflexota bacterium]